MSSPYPFPIDLLLLKVFLSRHKNQDPKLTSTINKIKLPNKCNLKFIYCPFICTHNIRIMMTSLLSCHQTQTVLLWLAFHITITISWNGTTKNEKEERKKAYSPTLTTSYSVFRSYPGFIRVGVFFWYPSRSVSVFVVIVYNQWLMSTQICTIRVIILATIKPNISVHSRGANNRAGLDSTCLPGVPESP